MAGQRVAKEQAAGRAGPAGRVHVQFEARIGNFYETVRGRRVKLLRIEPPNEDCPEAMLGFGYVDQFDKVIRLGPSVDGFDMRERMASKLMVRVERKP